jgi:hypothetical protein
VRDGATVFLEQIRGLRTAKRVGDATYGEEVAEGGFVVDVLLNIDLEGETVEGVDEELKRVVKLRIMVSWERDGGIVIVMGATRRRTMTISSWCHGSWSSAGPAGTSHTSSCEVGL